MVYVKCKCQCTLHGSVDASMYHFLYRAQREAQPHSAWYQCQHGSLVALVCSSMCPPAQASSQRLSVEVGSAQK